MMWAFDTTGPWVAVAAHDGDRLLGVRRCDVRLRHNEMLQHITGDLRDDCSGQLPHTIALCVGPGSFTGTRVGTAFAAGLAEAVGAQVIPVSSFEVAASLAPPDCVRIGVAIPVVKEIWCLARLVRTHRGWQEEALDELPVDRIRAGGEDAAEAFLVPGQGEGASQMSQGAIGKIIHDKMVQAMNDYEDFGYVAPEDGSSGWDNLDLFSRGVYESIGRQVYAMIAVKSGAIATIVS